MAFLAAGARRRVGRSDDDAECVPRSRPSELDSQFRSIRPRRRARLARARDCGSIRRSKGQVRIMRPTADQPADFVLSRFRGLVIAVAVGVAADATAASKAIKAGAVIDSQGKATANAVIVIDNDRIV